MTVHIWQRSIRANYHKHEHVVHLLVYQWSCFQTFTEERIVVCVHTFERPWHFFKSTGHVKTSSCYGIVSTTFQSFFFMYFFEQSIASILYWEEGKVGGAINRRGDFIDNNLIIFKSETYQNFSDWLITLADWRLTTILLGRFSLPAIVLISLNAVIKLLSLADTLRWGRRKGVEHLLFN